MKKYEKKVYEISKKAKELINIIDKKTELKDEEFFKMFDFDFDYKLTEKVQLLFELKSELYKLYNIEAYNCIYLLNESPYPVYTKTYNNEQLNNMKLRLKQIQIQVNEIV